MTPRRHVATKGRSIVAFLVLALIARAARAQTLSYSSSTTTSAHDRLMQLYTSTSTPPHYARAIQSLLQSQAPLTAVQSATGTALGTDSIALGTSDLSGVRIFPNPYKPNSGDPTRGVSFTPGNPTSGIVFDTLTPAATIKVYTVSGQLIRTLGPPNGAGVIQWDVRNDDGRDVSSGLYLAIITSPGVSKSVKKVMVVR